MAGIFRGEEYFKESNLKLMARRLTKVLKAKIELLKASIF